MRMARVLLAAVLMAAASVSFAQSWTGTRVSPADWSCCADAECKTVISSHQREGTAQAACSNLTMQDGVDRYVRGGTYRISRSGASTPPPTASCTAPKPADETRSQSCPTGTTGQWSQTRTYASAPYPTCWSPGNWTPSAPASGQCAAPLGSVTLTWTSPTHNADGSVLTDLAGYRILYGVSATSLTQTISVNPALTTYVVENLTPATWYFAMKAYRANGVESAQSNVASKTVQ